MLNPVQFQSLANHWSPDGGAISFYYSPSTPQNRAHTNTVLSAKEQMRELARSLKRRPDLRGIFERLQRRLESLTEENPHGLAILAAADPEVWFETELPYRAEPLALAGNYFAVSQLVPLTVKPPKYFVLLLDRAVTRLVSVSGEDFVERTKEFGEPRQQVRETGAKRKVSDERSKDDDAFHHLREVGTRMLNWLEDTGPGSLYVGCRDELWPEIEAAMPENTLAKVAGHFHCDPCLVTLQEIRALVQPLIDERTARDLQRSADDVRGAALGGRNGVLGPAEVASALEQGETQTIFVAPHDPIPTGVCSNCEHIDVKAASVCSLCGGEMRIFDDLEEAIARRSGRGTFQLLRVPHGMLDAKCQGFMAGLRFRADRRGTEASSQAA